MTGWGGNEDLDRDVLVRIGALLFALAGLADLAAGAPLLRRRQVLGILSFGEAKARAFVIGMVFYDSVPAEAPGTAGDAALLAASCRALALLLCAVLARAARFALPIAAGSRASRSSHKTSGPAVRWLDASPPPVPDTS